MTAFQFLFADHGDPYMPFPANTPTVDDLPGLGLQDIAQLPVELLAILQRDVDERIKRDKAAKARLDGALTVRYATRAADERQAAGKDTGTIRFDDGDFTVVADLPKRVDWDQDRLAAMVERIRAAYAELAARLDIPHFHILPISALEGDNVVHRSRHSPWYDGEPLLPLRSALGRLPWRGLMFIAFAVTVSLGATRVLGLDRAVADIVELAEAHGLTAWEIMLAVILAVGLLTEIMSNTVVALVFFPVVHGAAAALEIEPVAALVGVSLMSTVPFMSPTGAPSNAVVIGETRGLDYLLVVRLGLGLELLTAFALTMASLHIFPRVLGLVG